MTVGNDVWEKPFTANSLLDTPLSSDMSVYAKWSEAVHTHTEVTDAAVAPTDTTDGLTEGKHCSECGEVLIKQEVVPALLQGTAIKSQKLEVNGETITTSLSNTTETFSFLNDLTVANGASYVVARDIGCEQTIASKTVTLEIGDNTYYILVTNGNAQKLYTVTVRRRPMYTVSFTTNGGTSVSSQTVEEGSLATEPTTTRAGYTFAGWDHDFTTPIMTNTRITASWTPHTNIAYKVEYYLQNLNDNNYTRIDAETENLTGTAGTQVNAEQKTFTHFTLNPYMGTLSGNVNGNGSLVLKVYYARNKYRLSNANTNYGSITNAGSYKYGLTSITSTATADLGCEFLGCYSGNERISTDTTYTFTVEKNVEARFDVKAEMANFNFTSTATTCSITGITNKTVTEIVVPNYVTSMDFAVFKDCNSLTSITLPFLGSGKREHSTTFTHLGYIFGANWSSDNNEYVPTSLKTVVVTNSTIIDNYAFSGCSSLISIIISNSATSIGNYAFEDCSSLISIKIPASILSIGSAAFSSCNNLTGVYITDIVTWCGIQFANFYSNPLYFAEKLYLNENPITKMDIPSSVTAINSKAFMGYRSLTSITIPTSVTFIGSHAFLYCSGLTNINYCGTEEQWNAITKDSGWDSHTGNYTITYNYTGE